MGAFGDAGNILSLREAKQPLSKQVDLEEKENIDQPIKRRKTRGTRGGKKLREKREQRELRERNRKIGNRVVNILSHNGASWKIFNSNRVLSFFVIV